MINESTAREIFLIASRLLQYPGEGWKDMLREIMSDIAKSGDKTGFESILNFGEYAMGMDELDLEEEYVNTFDFTNKTNLYLSYYNLEEQRERGSALIKIKKKFDEAGYSLSNGELPDFLPVVMEFASIAEMNVVKDLLDEYRHVIQNIYKELSGKSNPYRYIFENVLQAMDDLGGEPASTTGLNQSINCGACGGADI